MLAQLAALRASVDLDRDCIGSFGDARLDATAALFAKQMRRLKTVCLRKLSHGTKALQMAFGRLLDNDRFTVEEMINHAAAQTVERARDSGHILVIQDSTELVFDDKWHPTKKGFGPVHDIASLGLQVQPALAVDAHSGACLGLLAMSHWVRRFDKKDKEKQRRKPIETRESMHWLTVSGEVRNHLWRDLTYTVICDREGDIFEHWERFQHPGSQLLIRAANDRRLTDGSSLYETIDNLPVADTYDVELPAVTGKRSARTAHVELRFGKVTIKRAKNCSDKQCRNQVTLHVVDVREVGKIGRKEEKTRLHWRILTTHRVEDLPAAKKVIDWYKQRWVIEQLFRTLKRGGLNVETSQLVTQERTIKLVAAALIAAVQVMQLTLAREGKTKRPYRDSFGKDDLPLLKQLAKRYVGTAKQNNPHAEGSLAWAAWIIARLGGWTGYASERPPGPITMKYGLDQFYQLKRGWDLARDV